VVDYKPNNPLQCIKCLGFGHRANTCTLETTCKKCAEKGHNSKDCPNPSTNPKKCSNCKGDHSATFAACPSFQKAKHQAEGSNILKHHKISKPAEPLDATRLATCITFTIITSLRPHIDKLDYKSITDTVRKTVNILYKAQIDIEHIRALLPQIESAMGESTIKTRVGGGGDKLSSS